MATFETKYGVGDRVWTISRRSYEEYSVVLSTIVAVQHNLITGDLYRVDCANDWIDEKDLYTTEQEAVKHYSEDLIEIYRNEQEAMKWDLKRHEDTVNRIRSNIADLEKKIKKLEK